MARCGYPARTAAVGAPRPLALSIDRAAILDWIGASRAGNPPAARVPLSSRRSRQPTMSQAKAERTIEAKVVILGHTGVGKTSMLNRYIYDQFRHTSATVGAAFAKKDVVVGGGTTVSLQIWDTAGQERFRSMSPMYYRGAALAVLVFDATQPETLEKVDGWVAELQEHASGDLILVIASNKSDLRDAEPDNAVPRGEAEAYAREVGATLFDTSAKSGRGINELFSHVAKSIADSRPAGADGAGSAGAAGDRRRGVGLTEDDVDDDGDGDGKKKKKCC